MVSTTLSLNGLLASYLTGQLQLGLMVSSISLILSALVYLRALLSLVFLFILFINDLLSSTSSNIYSFADDDYKYMAYVVRIFHGMNTSFLEGRKKWWWMAKKQIVGALGLIKNGCKKHLDRIPGQPQLQKIHQIILTSTAHIIRKTLSI